MKKILEVIGKILWAIGVVVIASTSAALWMVEIFNTPETRFIALLGFIGCNIWATIEVLRLLSEE